MNKAGALLFLALLLTSQQALAVSNCCVEHPTPGCDTPEVQACVCEVDSYCCDTQWDATCVEEVTAYGCGECPVPAVCGDGQCGEDEHCASCPVDCGACQGDCCLANMTAGCSNTAIANCVCNQDPFCCTDFWDEACVAEVTEFGCGNCEAAPVCGDGACNGEESCVTCPADCGACSGDCCVGNGTPGCQDAAIMDCVCAQDPFCCTDFWDETCASEVATFGCGSCGTGPGCGDGTCAADETCGTCPADCGACSGDCCQPNGTPGCQDAAITACVCALDAYCCTNEWDEACVEEVNEFGCGDCGGGADCGNGECGDNEHCANCPVDCGACSGDCCAAHETKGCDDAAIATCVCAQDAYCCTDGWDEVCVDEVAQFGCGDCGEGPECGNGTCSILEDCVNCPADCGACSGDCCADNGTPGCNDAAVQNCVCDMDSYCCTDEWDEICAQEVNEFGCGDCGAAVTCGNGTCDVDETCTICPEDCGYCPGDGECCQANGTPGCVDAVVQACVCALDSYCCETAWDYTCASEVESFGCGECLGGTDCGDGICAPGESCQNCPEDCGPCSGQGSCCEVHDSPGCSDTTVQACVCQQDSFCCQYVWDQVCVDEVTQFGCGTCDGSGPTCGNGECDGIEDCLTCPQDCGECVGVSCCEAHDTPACEDAEVAACVCNEDAYCCQVEWDGVCVDEVTEFGCGTCDGQVGGCGDGQCGVDESCSICPQDCGACPATGPCCEAHETPGCVDPSVQKCVCDQDAYCCDTAWDQTCVDEVTGLNCGMCGECVPDCADKACGADGCGGSCGTCPEGQSCQASQCVEIGGCTPDCLGLECGDDGCGGSCGSCAPGWKCHSGTCKESVCQPDCTGMQCGDDGCGGSCGMCPDGFFCVSGHCKKNCVPDCTGKQCGDDGCGGSCGNCPVNTICTVDGHCSDNCVPNCVGKQCGPDGCGGSCGSCPPDSICNAQGHCASDCHPNCVGKQCGDDGCGGSCGACPNGQTCNNQGHCVSGCVPDCTGKECGSDGCGGSCGTCSFGQSCDADNKCADVCVPNCLGKECGPNGCGGSCGSCGNGQICAEAGYCTDCTPDCEGKQCGDDGCGGSCGECPDPLLCDEDKSICVAALPDEDIVTESDAYADVDDFPCPAGQVLQWGKCVPVEDDSVPGGDAGGGCTTGATPTAAPWLLVLLLLGLAVTRRKTVRPER